jgi:hypothetical protein
MKGLPLLMIIWISCQATSSAIFLFHLDRLLVIKLEGSLINLSESPSYLKRLFTMLAPTVILSALISSSIAALLPSAVEPASDALITPGPQIEVVRRQNDQRYMGWVADEADAWSTEICDLGALCSSHVPHAF